MSLKSNIAKVYGQSSVRSAQSAYTSAQEKMSAAQAAFDKASAALNAAMTTADSAEATLKTLVVDKVNALQMRTEVGHSFITLAAVDLKADGSISKRYPSQMYVRTRSALIPAPLKEGTSLRRQLRALRAAHLR